MNIETVSYPYVMDGILNFAWAVPLVIKVVILGFTCDNTKTEGDKLYGLVRKYNYHEMNALQKKQFMEMVSSFS